MFIVNGCIICVCVYICFFIRILNVLWKKKLALNFSHYLLQSTLGSSVVAGGTRTSWLNGSVSSGVKSEHWHNGWRTWRWGFHLWIPGLVWFTAWWKKIFFAIVFISFTYDFRAVLLHLFHSFPQWDIQSLHFNPTATNYQCKYSIQPSHSYIQEGKKVVAMN